MVAEIVLPLQGKILVSTIPRGVARIRVTRSGAESPNSWLGLSAAAEPIYRSAAAGSPSHDRVNVSFAKRISPSCQHNHLSKPFY
jgi:hypothetical protein